MRFLAILLLAPWLIILGWAYCSYPKSLPRNPARRAFDVAVLLLAVVASVALASLGFDHVALPQAGQYGVPSGSIWQQVLPVLIAYGVFLAALSLGLWLRHLVWGRRRR